MKRVKTRAVQMGSLTFGNDSPVWIQSMCNTKTEDIEATVGQILALEDAGCEIIRVAVPNMEAASAIKEIKKQIHIPLVADIHFDYKLAIASVEAGADKIRINPGNIGDDDRVKAVVEACKKKSVPIRVGVNSGSLEKSVLAKYGYVTAEALAESAINNVKRLERYDFDQIVVSIKSSDVMMSLEAYNIFADTMDYPLHIGITEAGTLLSGSVKSAVGIGILLSNGIGDTLRVSLTDNPVEEVKVARMILEALDLRDKRVNIVACPTCGRTQIDLIGLAKAVEEKMATVDKRITVAVMGCAVNGPGEAKEADLGVAGGNGEGLIFSHGEIIRKVPEDQLLEALMEEVHKF